MPPVSRWFIKTGIIYLLISLVDGDRVIVAGINTIGGMADITFSQRFIMFWLSDGLRSSFLEWPTGCFPGIPKSSPRGNETIGWITYAFINIGLLLRLFLEPVLSRHNGAWIETGLVLSAVLQWLAAVLFVTNTWKRVKGRG